MHIISNWIITKSSKTCCVVCDILYLFSLQVKSKMENFTLAKQKYRFITQKTKLKFPMCYFMKINRWALVVYCFIWSNQLVIWHVFLTFFVLFEMTFQHLNVMEDMLKDFMLGEHLLLVGNQVHIAQNFGFINWVDMVNWPPLRDWKLTFRALVLRFPSLWQ